MQAECAGITTEGQGGAGNEARFLTSSGLTVYCFVNLQYIGALEWKDCNV